MSIAAALSNAVSGLAATARATEIVSANVANAMTPGYGRREVMTSADPLSGGVRVDAIARVVNASLLADRRIAEAGTAASTSLAGFWKATESAIGVAGTGDSLTDRVSALEAALLSAASRPDNEVRLAAVASAAAEVATRLNRIGEAVTEARTAADEAIGAEVTRLRDALGEVARLNRAVIVEQANGRDAAGLIDERQRTIDAIAAIVPLREVPRDGGRIALFTAGGAVLLDGVEPTQISFSPAGQIQPGMAVGTAPVGRLVVGGEELSDRQMRLFAGGSLAAHFQIRDEVAPAMQAQVDAVARDLYERFADPALDPTLAPGRPGLFTDAGAAFDPAAETGLANRLHLSAAVDPAAGGDAWRLRDGLGAAAPGDTGRATLLNAMAQRLSQPRSSGSASVPPGARTAAGFAAELSSRASSRRVTAEEALAHDAARADALQAELLRDGVDTDLEMERLLALENAFAANAKVIAAADAMIATMLEI